MTKIKICGLKRPEDIGYANELQPDYIGFVFAKSKRQVTRAQAAELKGQLAPSIKAVGVFVKEEVVQVAKIANAGIIDVIQLHGDETPEFCTMLGQLTKAPVIKVIRVKDASSLENLDSYHCTYFLFDTYSATNYGGVGSGFDFTLLNKALIPRPFFLAGGLGATNVRQVIQTVQPYGVDVSGGVEVDGYKNLEKMQEFITAVRKGE